MPKYELMYIIGSSTAESDIPQVVGEVKKAIEAGQGLVEKHEELGKKKLAYPIQNSRTGYYVLDRFAAPAEAAKEIENKLRANQAVVRYLLLNIDEAERRQARDRAAQAKLKPRREVVKEAVRPRVPEKKIEIDLDAEIEKALESDELK